MAILNKSPLKILKKMERGRISRDCPNFLGTLLSQERIKLRTSNFEGTFIWSIGTKAHEKICGRSQGVPKIFSAHTHCAVIFAIAQLSLEVPH